VTDTLTSKEQLPRIPPKHLKDGCYARADALEAHLDAAKAEIERLTRERAIVNAAVTGRIANAPPVVEALQQFVQQWNACGPNSDFGRYFGNIRDIAVAALAKYQGMEEPADETLSPPRIYTHVKTGNQYEVLHDATETTNGSREGRGAIVYRRIGQNAVYVREATEFHERFVFSGERNAQKANTPLCSCGHDGRPGPGHQTNCPQYRPSQNGGEGHGR
jgi:hypothetical protein